MSNEYEDYQCKHELIGYNFDDRICMYCGQIIEDEKADDGKLP
ncbi:hypothetical protein [Bacillus cihuensis]|nr:hypothetical protein [Bacillus cihuensis]